MDSGSPTHAALDSAGVWHHLSSVTASGNTVTFQFSPADVPFTQSIALRLIVPERVWSTVTIPVTSSTGSSRNCPGSASPCRSRRRSTPPATATCRPATSARPSARSADPAARTWTWEHILLTQGPVTALFYGATWGEYSTKEFAGWPDAAYSFAPPDGSPPPDRSTPLMIITHLIRT